MSDTNLTVRNVSNAASVIDVKGEITAGSEDELSAAYADASKNSPKAIVLNFSDLEYMNSGGIGLLVTMLVRANRQKQKLLAVGLNEHYRQIFELTRLDEAITIFDDETSALASV